MQIIVDYDTKPSPVAIVLTQFLDATVPGAHAMNERTSDARKVDVRLPGKGNLYSHGARPVHLIITMM